MNAAAQLLSADQAAERIGYSKDTINRLRRAGELRGVRVTGRRGHWRYDAADVDRLVNARKAEEARPVLPMKQPRGRRP